MSDWRLAEQNKRRARIIRFAARQERLGNWSLLSWAVHERSRRDLATNKIGPHNDGREQDALQEFRTAVGSGAFNPILNLSPSEPFRFLNGADAEQIGRMSLNHLRVIVPELWVRRSDLAALFNQKEWHAPVWLQVGPAGKQGSSSTELFVSKGPTIKPLDEENAYRNWIEQNRGKRPPNREADRDFMRGLFGPAITQERLRSLRRELAPSEWTNHGRPRKK